MVILSSAASVSSVWSVETRSYFQPQCLLSVSELQSPHGVSSQSQVSSESKSGLLCTCVLPTAPLQRPLWFCRLHQYLVQTTPCRLMFMGVMCKVFCLFLYLLCRTLICPIVGADSDVVLRS